NTNGSDEELTSFILGNGQHSLHIDLILLASLINIILHGSTIQILLMQLRTRSEPLKVVSDEITIYLTTSIALLQLGRQVRARQYVAEGDQSLRSNTAVVINSIDLRTLGTTTIGTDSKQKNLGITLLSRGVIIGSIGIFHTRI